MEVKNTNNEVYYDYNFAIKSWIHKLDANTMNVKTIGANTMVAKTMKAKTMKAKTINGIAMEANDEVNTIEHYFKKILDLHLYVINLKHELLIIECQIALLEVIRLFIF